MSGARLTAKDLVVAGACAAWAAAFLASEGAVALVGVPMLFAALLPRRWLPLASAVGVGAVAVVVAAADVPGENPATVAACLVVAYSAGRHAGMRTGLAAVAVLVAAVVGPAFAVPDLVFVSVVCGATWGAGRIVRRRSEAADRAVADAAELAARDPDALAARVVAEERARLAGDALAVIRRAVDAMHRRAVIAEPDLDRDALGAIQEDGARAVTELRRLLGLLRSGPDGDGAAAAAAQPPSPSPLRVDAAVAAVLAAMVIAEANLRPKESSVLAVALSVAFVAAPALRRLDPVLACVVAAGPLVVALVIGEPLVFELAAAIAYALLAWSAAVDGQARSYAALAAFLAVSVVLIHETDPGNEAMVVGLSALAALAGRAWAGRDRRARAAEATAGDLRAAQEAAAQRAVRAERLRLARELHDVASHAVGVMVLQAGAALALRDRDPAAARTAIRSIQTAGVEATSELQVLFGLLDAGAIGGAGATARAAGDDASEALRALVDRMRAGGLDVELVDAAGAAADDALVAGTAFRIVQEALTNAVRHAPGSRVRVELDGDDGALSVTVRDDGPGAQPQVAGFGLVGLSERVRALGGEFSAGPGPGGGFAVRARLPVSTAVRSVP